MSHEEQATMVGRLVLERAEINRQRSLLASEIKSWGVHIGNLSGDRSLFSSPDKSNIVESIRILDGVIAAGGLEKFRKILNDYRALSEKAADIGQTLRNAGAE